MKKISQFLIYVSVTVFFLCGFTVGVPTAHAGIIESYVDAPYQVDAQQPDLTVSAPSPVGATMNVPLTFSTTVTNGGDLTTGTSFSVLYQSSSDGGVTFSDLGPVTVGVLAAGSSAVATSSSTTFAVNGTFIIKACADKSSASNPGVITESNEGNNCNQSSLVVSGVPKVTLTANPTTGTAGVVNPTLTWTTTNSPTSCNATGDWTNTPSKALGGGSELMGILSTIKTYSYSLTCTNATGTSAVATATVQVVSAPVINTFTISPVSGAVGTVTPTLSWTTSNAPTSCTATGDWNGAKSISSPSSETLNRLNIVKTYSYTLTCANSIGSDSKTVTIPITASGGTYLPDLTMSMPTTYTALVNRQTLFSAVVTNEGTANTDAGASTAYKGSPIWNFFQSTTDSYYAPANIDSRNASASPPLEIGGINTVSIPRSFSSIGTWYVRFCADSDDHGTTKITELNEGNNCTAWAVVNVESSDPTTPYCGNALYSCINTDFSSSATDTAAIPPSVPAKTAWRCVNVAATCYAPYPQCKDGIDNDADGKVDFPADLGCVNATDTSEGTVKIKVGGN